MTQGQIDSISSQLREMNLLLSQLHASQRAAGRELADIKNRVKETNGRVTALEAQEIRDRAVAEERSRMLAESAEQQQTGQEHRWRLHDRLIGAGVTIACVVLGAVLADLRFF
jgi:hypothetical protein